MKQKYLNSKWQKSMALRFDYNNMLDEYVGGNQGITVKQITANSSLCKLAFDRVQANRGTGMMGWTELPYNQNEIVTDIIATAKQIRKNYTRKQNKQ